MLGQAVKDGLLLRNPADAATPPTAKRAKAPEIPSHTCVIAAESHLTFDTAETAPSLPPPAVRIPTPTWKGGSNA